MDYVNFNRPTRGVLQPEGEEAGGAPLERGVTRSGPRCTRRGTCRSRQRGSPSDTPDHTTRTKPTAGARSEGSGEATLLEFSALPSAPFGACAITSSEEVGNGFGNDADTLSVSSLLAEQLSTVAEGVARRATATPAALAKLHPCASNVTTESEGACARTIVERIAPLAYRRPLAAGEADELLALYSVGRTDATFDVGIATVIEALLQSPDFLYRIEWGTPDPERPELRRPTGDEMATRLSYLLWGTMPDEELRRAAQAGELSTKEGVRAQADRMLEDPRLRTTVRFFFDNLLPISNLADLERNAEAFPTFSRTIGWFMREETQRFVEHEIFEGTCRSLATSPRSVRCSGATPRRSTPSPGST
ncbi:DUF1592 domain-containing protein [Sorangium sp. So ce260]|uniref:DUF1592 domain-containing protein n=1 Tax=Sorangium sp. So ce260 TaxID=3133291 RepID=UPI003F63652A